MKDFRKRTLALVLASVVTVAGSFASENYKNSLMNLDLKADENNSVNITVETAFPYSDPIIPRKIDANTYVIMLPEVNAREASKTDLTTANGRISAVEIETRPYTTSGKGYAKITLKTMGQPSIQTKAKVFITEKSQAAIETSSGNIKSDIKSETEPNRLVSQSQQEDIRTRKADKKAKIETEEAHRKAIEEQIRREAELNTDTNKPALPIENHNVIQTEEVNSNNNIQPSALSMREEKNSDPLLLALGGLFVLITSCLIYLKAKDKMAEVLGEKLEIDITEEENPQKNKKNKSQKDKIRATINKLDSKYTTSSAIQRPIFKYEPKSDNETQESDSNVVDLDELFKTQSQLNENNNSTEESGSAFDEFLKEFSFDDFVEEIPEEEENIFTFNEEFYEQLLNKKDITFSKTDIECFKDLLQLEIYDETLKNIKDYAISSPIAPIKPSSEKVLETLVADYAISQNIIFTNDDIKILKKLIEVEIDNDFLTDLRTNPKKTKEMEEDIINAKHAKQKTSQILTLNVRDMLPNLSEELRRQGNRPIESEAKPDVVYYSKDYDFKTLNVDFDLPNLSEELNNKDITKRKPSAIAEIVDNSYNNVINKLNISDQLPDLEDVIAHPDKYKEPEQEKFTADEDTLLNSLSNVKFKPFDDGTRNFEIINDIPEPEPVEESPSVYDIQKEFTQFQNFEISNEEFNNYNTSEQILPDDDSKESDAIVQEPQNTEISKAVENSTTISDNQKLNSKFQTFNESPAQKNKNFTPKTLNQTQKRQSKSAEELLKKIEILRAEREIKRLSGRTTSSNKDITKKSAKPLKLKEKIKCIIDGVSYEILNSSELTENSGCHLAKYENGYAILSYQENRLEILKTYDNLKSENIQTRLVETLDDGTQRYLVRVGINKILIDKKESKINYVMDLC